MRRIILPYCLMSSDGSPFLLYRCDPLLMEGTVNRHTQQCDSHCCNLVLLPRSILAIQTQLYPIISQVL